MDLKEFVETTILEVLEGVQAAQGQFGGGGVGGLINPYYRGRPVQGDKVHESMRGTIQQIEFDVAIVASASSGSGAKLQVGGSFLGGGVKGESDQNRTEENRIRFAVPVVFPVQGGPKEWKPGPGGSAAADVAE